MKLLSKIKTKLGGLTKHLSKLKNFRKSDDSSDDGDHDEDIALGTKVKVIAAFLVVGLASYVAYWVQEPTDIKVDSLSDSAPAVVEEVETETVAAADEDFPTIAEVSIVDFTFTPANLTVEAGTTVVWTNLDSIAHTITSENFSSGSMEAGESYNYIFDQKGVYDYVCSFHPQMQGRIIVEEASAPVDLEDAYLGEEIAEGYFSSLSESEDSISPELLAVDEPSFDVVSAAMEEPELHAAAAVAADDSPGLITFEDESLMADDDTLHEAARAVEETDELATTGPEDFIYIAMFIGILVINRRKILSALQ